MSNTIQPTDIAICGAGPVGLALALQLVQRGVAAERITLIDARPLDKAAADPRSIAISHGSQQLLNDIGCWPVANDAITAIHVSRKGYFGRTRIEASEHQLPALGYVTRYGSLVTALAQQAAQRGIQILRPWHLAQVEEDAEHVTLTSADQHVVRANVLVQAEGGVFAEQTAKATHRDYEQVALVAHVDADAIEPGTAYERFTDEGPLALLPQDGGFALVWCAKPDTAARLHTLSDSDFLTALQNAFGTRAGTFTHVKSRHQFPLGLNAQHAATARTVAIGNAAQTLHPVAGQGLNLGLRDAAVLAKFLAASTPTLDLTQFLAHRRTDRSVTIHLTDLLARIFATPMTPAQSLLGVSLGMVDALPPAKRLLAEHMMFGHR